MECEEINAAALAVVIEGDLDEDLPGVRLKPSFPAFLQECVIGIQQAIQITVRNTDRQSQVPAGGRDCGTKGSECVLVEEARLKIGDKGTRHGGSGGKVGLTPSLPMAKRSNHPTNQVIAQRFPALRCKGPVSTA